MFKCPICLCQKPCLRNNFKNRELINILFNNLNKVYLNADFLAVSSGLSRTKISNFFKTNYEMKTKYLIQCLRIIRVIKLMKRTKLKLNYIFSNCGYAEYQRGLITFKRVFTKTPKEYRDNIELKRDIKKTVSHFRTLSK